VLLLFEKKLRLEKSIGKVFTWMEKFISQMMRINQKTMSNDRENNL
jgi:hypothetical protein